MITGDQHGNGTTSLSPNTQELILTHLHIGFQVGTFQIIQSDTIKPENFVGPVVVIDCSAGASDDEDFELTPEHMLAAV